MSTIPMGYWVLIRSSVDGWEFSARTQAMPGTDIADQEAGGKIGPVVNPISPSWPMRHWTDSAIIACGDWAPPAPVADLAGGLSTQPGDSRSRSQPDRAAHVVHRRRAAGVRRLSRRTLYRRSPTWKSESPRMGKKFCLCLEKGMSSE